MLRNIFRYFFLLSTIIFVISCAPTMNITPQYAKIENISPVVNGKIDYDGNEEYLPRTISNDSSKNPLLIIKYQYHVDYGNSNIHFANLYNPLLFVGFPIGKDTLIVAGKIDIIKKNEVIKSYSAVSAFEKTRNIFYHGPTFSEVRKTGLLNVRDNIEAQMYNDREFLLKIKMQ